jgi:hypothetical protein
VRGPALSILCLVGALQAGCALWLPAHPRSERREDGRVALRLRHRAKDPVDRPCEAPPAPGPRADEAVAVAPAAALIPIVADFVVQQVVAEIAREAERYTADYAAFAADDRFYACRGPEAPINLEALELTRSAGGRQAFSLTVLVEPSIDGTAFKLVPAAARLDYAKAKVLGRRWYLPWSWLGGRREALDLDVEITIEALWTDAADRIHRAVIADLPIALRGVPLGPAPTAVPLDAASGWFPAVPRSRPKDPKSGLLGLGTYVVRARVREYDDFGRRVERLSVLVEKHREDLVRRAREAAE